MNKPPTMALVGCEKNID